MALELVNNQVVETGGARPFVEFYEHAKKVGVGKFEPVIYIKIKNPGYKDFMSRPATDEDKAEYSAEWAAFQKGVELTEGRTPLSQLPAYKTAWELELRVMGIDCVEVLAGREEPEQDYLKPMHKQAVMFMKLQETENEH